MEHESTEKNQSQYVDQPQVLLQLHIAEYQMLMSRLTNWITLQNSLWAVLIFFLTLIAFVWNNFTEHGFLLWGTVFVIQLVAVFWYVWQGEVYSSALYVERHLRPLVAKWVKNEPFWTWEEQVARRRGQGAVWWEWVNSIYPLLAISVVSLAISKRSWRVWDWLALCANVALYGFILYTARMTVKRRKEIFN